MECRLSLSVFRFDATTDFLPYNKQYTINVDTSKTVSDLLALIQAEDPTFGYPQGEFAAIKINGKALFTQAPLEKLIKSMGKELSLEPLSTKRCIKDMNINADDFYERFRLFKAVVTKEDLRCFESYKIYHYASKMVTINDAYYGDALFAFAADMIQKYPEHTETLLAIVANEENGIFSRIKLCHKIFPCGADVEKKITALQNDVIHHRPFLNPLVERLSRRVEAL